MNIGVVKETLLGERRVAMVPSILPALAKLGADVIVEAGAGDAAGFPDREYLERGATVRAARADIFADADLVCMVRTYSANTGSGEAELRLYRPDQTIVGLAEALSDRAPIEAIAATGVRMFALELVPRITRAQAMDVLSSQATVAGYKAVALAVDTLPKMFPMMMTAAGTIAPAKVFVIGAGVAGLQAIASARRAGAVVSAFDVRPEVKEQVESLGAHFVEINVGTAVGTGGYAREQTEDERRRQQELMAKTVAESDVVITTAAVPGKRAPTLVPADVARQMHPGSVIIDMAAERGGNCELTKPDETVDVGGVLILGPTNLASKVPTDASRMFAKNVSNLLTLIVKGGEIVIDKDDEIVAGTLETEGGEIVHPMARDIFGLPALLGAGDRADSMLFTLFLTIFVLAIFVGFEIITKVPPTLHTPLMSGANAISGITIVGALIVAGASSWSESPLVGVLGLFAVIFAMINVAGGFAVTHRMLEMFQKKK